VTRRIIATPGRFMHVVVEMNLKLSSVEYVVFDEADRWVIYKCLLLDEDVDHLTRSTGSSTYFIVM